MRLGLGDVWRVPKASDERWRKGDVIYFDKETDLYTKRRIPKGKVGSAHDNAEPNAETAEVYIGL